MNNQGSHHRHADVCLCVAGVLISFIAACSSGAPAGVPTKPIAATAVTVPASTVIAAAATATQLPPSATDTPAATPTVQDPTLTLAPPEPTTNATALIAAVVTAQPARVLETHDSPDGKWHAEITRSDCTLIDAANGENAYEQLSLINRATGESQLIADQLQNCGGLGAFGLGGLYWSRDSRYFFYTGAREGYPDGGCLGWYRPAARLEVATGERLGLVQGPQSPAGTWMAGIAGPELVVWRHDTGEIMQAPVAVSGLRAGALAWAPDGKALVYLQWTSDCAAAGGESTVVRFELASGTQSVVLTSQAPEFAKVIWDAPNRLRLFESDDHYEWRYNFATQTLTRFQ